MNDGNEEEESDDGYDSDLFENPEKAAEFKCPICTCICKDPIETEPCGHLYCRGCLQSHLNLNSMSDINSQNKEASFCPTCRSPISETSRSKFVERQVLKLRVKCANYNLGCKWKGELNYFKKHLQKQCQFVTLLCKYCKIKQYLRGAQKEHFAQCAEYPTECYLCLQKIARKNIQSHTETLCPNILLLCPNECGIKIKQSSLTNHIENECNNRSIDCLYHCYGCCIQPKYTDLKLHLSQHQITHLELKVLYLERLAQSTELLSVSNTTGLYPEISGMYGREDKPFYCRPVWRNRNNKTYLIRYDNILRGWVLDKKGFKRDIVALRMGSYPTATAKHPDAKHILQLEEMLITAGKVKQAEKHVENIVDNINEIEDEKKVEIIIKDKLEKKDKKDKKRGLFCDGLWHIKGNVENSRIKVRGYTEREFDLEWEFKSLAAQMRRQRSGIQHITINNNNNNNNNAEKKDNIRANYAVGCICGKGMIKINSNPYNHQDKDVSAICNICGNNVLSGIECYHCPAKRCTKHMDGYDLCLACGEARQQTQNLTQPSCDCGSKLKAMMSFNAYPNTNRVSCNVCSAVVDGAVWHCPKKYAKAHERGFDLCINCGKTYVGKKAGLMSWFK